MVSRTRRLLILATLVAIALWSTACSGDDPEPLSCGTFTELEDGVCVPITHDCEEGQILTPRGECEDEDSYCGEGTSYDSGLQECVFAGDVQCGEGTIEQDNRCVPQDLVSCGEGTVLADGVCQLRDDICGESTEFNEDEVSCSATEDVCAGDSHYDVVTEKCVYLNIVECGEDTIEVDDVCLPMTTFADNLAANADIDHSDGAAIVPDEDDQFVFTGVLDDELSQSFDFEGLEGQWLEITIYSRGLPSPGFSLEAPFGNWARNVVAGLQSAPTRTVPIPADGTYSLTVNTTLTDSDNASDFGGPSWQYVGTVDVVDAPDTFDWDVFEEPLDGNLKNTNFNYIVIDVTDVADVLLTPTMLGSDADGITIEAWTDPTTFAERHELTVDQEIEIDSDGLSTLYLHIDAVEFMGPNTSYELEARPTQTLEPGDIYTREVTADAGEMIFMSHVSDEAAPVAATVSLDGVDQIWIQELLAANQSSYSVDETKRHFYYAQQSGTYTVTYQNISSDTINSFVDSTVVDVVPVFELPDNGPFDLQATVDIDEELNQGDWRVVVIDSPGAAKINTWADPDSSFIETQIFDDQHQLIGGDSSFGNPNEYEFSTLDGGIFYFVAQQTSNFSTPDEYIEFRVDGQSFEVLAPGETFEVTFDAALFDILLGNVTSHLGDEFDVRLLNPDGFVLIEELDFDGNLPVIELFPGPGEYTLEVENSSNSVASGLTIDLDHHTPFGTLDEDSNFSETYQRSFLAEGEKEHLIFRPQSGFESELELHFGDDEEAALRVFNVSQNSTVESIEGQDPLEADVLISEGEHHIIEVEALTDLDDGYTLQISGTPASFSYSVQTFDPAFIVEIDDPIGQGSTSMSVSGCDTIQSVSLSTVIPTSSDGWTDVFLHAPGLSDRIGVRTEGSYASHTTTYPEETEPDESFDNMVGTTGNGTWELEFENRSCCTDIHLDEWSLLLVCSD